MSSSRTPPPKLLTTLSSPTTIQGSGNASGEHTPTAENVQTFKARGLFHHNSNKNDDEHAMESSWWDDQGGRDALIRRHSQKRRPLPPDQEIAYQRAKSAVAKALGKSVDVALDVTREAAEIGADALEFVPAIGLSVCARILVNIWNHVQEVETNRLSCLALTERCANILFSIRAEIDVVGDEVADSLREPMEKLTESFRRIEHFVSRQVSRPFLKRYLKRDEDSRKIIYCEASLTDTVSLFNVAIQLRMLKGIQELSHVHPHSPETPVVEKLLQLDSQTPPSSQEIVTAIASIRSAEAAQNTLQDAADLYAAMRIALRSADDAKVLELLQIDRNEIQEAIKTIQRALEDPRLTSGPVRAAIEGSSDSGHTESLISLPDVPASTTSEYMVAPFAPTAVWNPDQDAAFHREFLESGLDALRRLSVPLDNGDSLPHWTITKWEVDRENKIGWGLFSDVYKGTWRGKTVAIKVLARTTPRKLFKNEIAIWASLNHPNVLRLLGASSTTCDPPWFFVSPYMKNGTVEMFLRAKNSEKSRGRKVYPTPLRMMQEIAVGMTYLHRKGVLHGDLKANNVLIDDDFHCVISDFGQSKLRSEVYRLSQGNEGRGNLRWQAPEIMSGLSNLTPQADVYSFAIVCYEILSGGQVPWAMLDDQTVQRLVLVHDKRPAIQFSPETPLALVTLIDECWHKDPFVRPQFTAIARKLAQLLGASQSVRVSPSPQRKGRIQELSQEGLHRISPDMTPIELPEGRCFSPSISLSKLRQCADWRFSVITIDDKWSTLDFGVPLSLTSSRGSVLSAPPMNNIGAPLTKTMSELTTSQPPPYMSSGRSDIIIPTSIEKKDKSGNDSDDKKGSSTLTRSSSMHSWFPSSSSESDGDLMWGTGSPSVPPDPELMPRWDERRYRLLLQHDFHPTLVLPLWTPTPVKLGAVGYLSKPDGRFVTFFNCLNPFAAADKGVHGMASIHGYGNYREGSSTNKKNFAQIGRDIVKGILLSKGSVKKTMSQRLRAGHKHAFLFTEFTTYRYMVDIDVAKAWFKANIKTIWKQYGRQHHLHREDIFLVIGSLETRDYALFVSHENPDGQVYFDVFSDRKESQEWGVFRTDSDLPESVGEGPHIADAGLTFKNSTKISQVTGGRDADCVLLARLRFRPDEDEPTRL
ncbi:hypothetical protein Clacol_008317 [Clathrus columnatus]|uniref:Protein kinase domain-containing protein n=1 Tax=Clathrus columnatus TaxID=1419009 RepID=A0AAV5AMH7_9AGAM|nr:hypothetical protein Clacol_008317 [Clathrus columnatus]